MSAALEAICQQSNLGEWWSWWHARCYHIVPAFQGFNLPGVNLAESGNSFIKCRQKMSLAVAAWTDMILMIIQDRDYIAFKNQTAKVSGRGLNLKQRKEHADRAEENFIDRCCEALEEGDIEAVAMLETQPGEMFVPNKKAKQSS